MTTKRPIKTARFWEFINEDQVKLSLEDGQRLRYYSGTDTDEGFACQGYTWERDGDVINHHHDSWGRDCDGRHSTSSDYHVTLDKLTATPPNEHRDVAIPQWENGRVTCWDQYAEADNY
jgi:hypothetical protein